MNIKSKLLLSTSIVCSLLVSPLIAMDDIENQDAIPRPVSYFNISSFFYDSPRTSLQPKVPFEDVEMGVQKQHSTDFMGVEAFDKNVVISHRTNHANFNGKVTDAFFSFNDSAIYPLAQKLENFLVTYLKENPIHQPTKWFIRELQFQKESQDINPLWLLGIHLRFAASISKPTKDERNLFKHVPYPNIFFGMLEKEAWKKNLSSYLNVSEYDNKGFELENGYSSRYLSGNALSKLEDTTLCLLPTQVVYPVLGIGKMGTSFLVKSYLNDIFVVGFPTQELLEGHGIMLSRFGFLVHDVLHYKVDRRQHELMSHIVNRGDEYIEQGGNAWDFIKIYPSVAVKKYSVLMNSLQEIYGNLVAKLLPYRGLEEYRKAMVGFFWIMHEAPNFPNDLYETNDFDKVVETITSHSSLTAVNAAVDDIDSWESSYDPLETSPIDGSSSLEDKEIFTWVFENMYMGDAQSYKYGPLQKFQQPIPQADIVKKRIKRTNRFIDVTFKTNSGEELKYSFPTLYHKMKNARDNINLLHLSGIKVDMPNLKSSEDPRTLAQVTLDRIHIAIKNHVEHFRKVASFFANYDSQGNETSLAQRYFRWHFNQEKSVNRLLSKHLQNDSK